MTRCKLFGLFLIAVLALAAAPALAENAAVPQPNSAVAAAPAACGLNLTALATPAAATGETCAAQPKSEVPDFLTNSKRLGYCHCGCVAQRVCRTSDDCGGASCDQFISCC